MQEPMPLAANPVSLKDGMMVTVFLADGRPVDIFANGTVQVYSGDAQHAHGYEFALPNPADTREIYTVGLIRIA
jgi:hypothetical protein